VGLMVLGYVALLLAAGGFVLISLQVTRGFTVERLKPAWWLIHDIRRIAMSGGSASDVAACRELARRVTAGSLSQHSANEAADIALALQADLTKPWRVEFGDLLDAMVAANKLSPDRLQRYIEHAPVVSLTMPTQLHRGETLYTRLRSQPGRVGSRNSWILNAYGPTISSPAIGNIPSGGSIGMSIAFASGTQEIGDAVKNDTPLGPTTVQVTIPMDMQDTNPIPRRLDAWSFHLTQTIQILAPGELPHGDTQHTTVLRREPEDGTTHP